MFNTELNELEQKIEGFTVKLTSLSVHTPTVVFFRAKEL